MNTLRPQRHPQFSMEIGGVTLTGVSERHRPFNFQTPSYMARISFLLGENAERFYDALSEYDNESHVWTINEFRTREEAFGREELPVALIGLSKVRLPHASYAVLSQPVIHPDFEGLDLDRSLISFAAHSRDNRRDTDWVEIASEDERQTLLLEDLGFAQVASSSLYKYIPPSVNN
jgi:hypothetical protein